MKPNHNSDKLLILIFIIFIVVTLGVSPASAQTCLTAAEMDAATRSALQSAATRYFDMIQRGDSASLKQNAIPSLASNFAGIEETIKENQPNLAGAHATPRPPFVLKAEGTAPLPRAEFLCGIFNASGPTPNAAEFVIPNLPPGSYGIEILDVTTPKSSYTGSFVLQQTGSDWKLGGLFLRPAQVEGHDSSWYLNQANSFKSKGHSLAAWLYYLEGRELAIAVPFMETQATDKLYEQESNYKMADFPGGDKTVDLVAANGKTYKLTQMFPLQVGQDLDVIVKYQTTSIADTGQTFQDNMAVMKALVTKYPELRDAFGGVVARGVEPSGKDYGTMMQMKDLK
ncbi:MAG TPA: hypothetical protein VJP02_24190 [Candidatus Sulfotelmatobacter sp.]|nr:hypothetical protein [Candidatus Sulfotelmatobacter sp.]